jgi:hypothetical protein
MDSDTGDQPHTIDISGMLAPQMPYGAGYDTSIPNIVVTAPKIGGGGRGLAGAMRSWTPPAGGFEWRDLGSIGDPIRISKGLDVHWTDMPDKFDKKTEQPQTTEQQKQSFFTKMLGRLQNIKDKDKRRAWFKRLIGNLARINPTTAPFMLANDLVKAVKGGGSQGILGALTNMGMQRVFGKNLDVARGVLGTATGRYTPAQALGRVGMNRGMRAGMDSLMKAAYKQGGMPAVRTVGSLMQTLMQRPPGG